MNYQAAWDLSTIPDEQFASEHGRRRRSKGPRAPNLKLEPCKHCGEPLSARQRRLPCVKCDKRQRAFVGNEGECAKALERLETRKGKR